jgi:hypothetical protein
MSDERREVVVLETTDVTELRLARNLLEQDGIPCRIDGGGASALLGAVLGAQFGGLHSILVPAECEERALLMLARAWPESPADSEG